MLKGRMKTKRTYDRFEMLNEAANPRPKTSVRGLGRALTSATSLIIGGFLLYTAMHYAASFTKSGKLIAMSGIDVSAMRLRPENRNVLTPFRELFQLRRAYLRPGDALQVQYFLPRGAALDLSITRCRSIPVIEVYRCKPVATQEITIARAGTGTREFRMKDAGFYYVDDSIRGQDGRDYKVAWRRG